LTLEWPRPWFLLLFLLLLSGCFSEDESERPVPVIAPIDVSGVWVGTWSGYDPEIGSYVSGNWEAELNQNGTTVGGTGTLTGDIDCTDGVITGSLSKQYVISGELVREPCGTNEWVITSLSLLNREVSALWTKSSVGGEGAFAGIQVATPDGPRIRYFHPPGGLPGTVVAVTGERFADDAADNILDFNGTRATDLQLRDNQRIITEVPAAAAIGPLTLTTTSSATPETGRSVLSFNTAVTYPTPENINATIDLGDYGSKGIAITPNGRRAFVVFSYNVTMFDVASSEKLGYGAYTTYQTQAIVASPDNKHVYVSTAYEVLIMHAGMNYIVDRITAPGGDTSKHNPHGLAITPDGKTLLVADNHPGGDVSVINIKDKTIVHRLGFAATATPYGIAISPDGLFAYIAVHGLNQVKVYSLDTYAEINTFDVGSEPTGLAILPDGSTLYVSNTADGTVSVIDLASGTILSPVIVGNGPKGVAVSPDGTRVYTADYGSNSVSIIDAATNTVTSLQNINAPIAVSILPEGYRGYVSSNASSSVSQIGGPATLTILKGGGGIGTVTSWPDGIYCGEMCRAEFTYNTDVTLTASASSNSTFNGWSGDCTGTDNIITVTMDSAKNCYALFYSIYVNTGGSTPGSYDTNYYCFIATAAYGSYLDPHVEVLRAFRDEYLLTNAAGRNFVEWYYENSPPVAEYLSQHEGLRAVVRLLLTPVVYGIMYPVTALMLLTGIASLLLWKRHYNQSRN
jgi:YVTN family beta-propeller protein